jgi:hypothetical protein
VIYIFIDAHKQQNQQIHKALCISFNLPSSTYATVLLRELTKQSMSVAKHTALNTSLANTGQPANDKDTQQQQASDTAATDITDSNSTNEAPASATSDVKAAIVDDMQVDTNSNDNDIKAAVAAGSDEKP